MVTPLPVGTTIRTANQKTYVITSYIGRDGTSLVYSASQGGADAFWLKEACPYDDRGLVRRDLVIVPEREHDGMASLRLTECRIMALHEKKTGEEIRVSSTEAVILQGDLLVNSITTPDGASARRREGEAYGPGGSVFCAMQSVNGRGSFLSQMIQARRNANTPFTVWEIAQIGQKILEALAALHEQGFVHCDLTPCNLYFEPVANPTTESIGEAFITDFGSAKRIDPKTGRTPPADRIYGSQRFLAPEMRARGATLTQKADVFAVGLLLLELMDMLPRMQTPQMYGLMDEELLRWHGATPCAARAFMALLRGSLQDEEALRFTPREALDAASALCREAKPPEYRPANTMSSAMCDRSDPGIPVPSEETMAGCFRRARLQILSDLETLTEAERAVLCHAALLPEDGMDQALFLQCEEEDAQAALNSLKERNLLQCGEDHRLRILALLRALVRETLKPEKGDCDPFLDRLWRRITTEETDFHTYQNATDLFFLASIWFDDRTLRMRSGPDGIIRLDEDLDLGEMDELLEQHLNAVSYLPLKAEIVREALYVCDASAPLFQAFLQTAAFFPKAMSQQTVDK